MSYNDLRKGRYSAIGQEYFITLATRNRRRVFADLSIARLLIQEMRRTEQQGWLHWLAWVVMPDHLHALIRLESATLSTAIGAFKGRSARLINRRRENRGGLWQPDFFDHAIREEEDRVAIARYIVANPLRAGLVQRIGDRPHWDSIWL